MRLMVGSRKPADLIASDVRTKIRSMILAAELRPGQRLVEDELSEVLGVGRTPVREALLLLEGEGYIERQRGWVVHAVDGSRIHSIFESRAVIEGAVARLAARRISPAACLDLERLTEAMSPSLPRPEINRLNTEFHALIVASAENEFLAQFHERTQFYYWMLRIPIMFADDQLASTVLQHRAIVSALIRHDEDAADRAAREHVEATMRIVEPALIR